MAIVLYARKSVERENSISCETQLEYCKMMIRPDERDEKIIPLVDNGFSGGNVNRDGFQKMMRLVKQGKIKKVIVYKLDRISRSLSDFVNILQEFKAHKVEFVSSQESFDTSSPYGDRNILFARNNIAYICRSHPRSCRQFRLCDSPVLKYICYCFPRMNNQITGYTSFLYCHGNHSLLPLQSHCISLQYPAPHLIQESDGHLEKYAKNTEYSDIL